MYSETYSLRQNRQIYEIGHILNCETLSNFIMNHVSKRRLCSPIPACLLLFLLSETKAEII